MFTSIDDLVRKYPGKLNALFKEYSCEQFNVCGKILALFGVSSFAKAFLGYLQQKSPAILDYFQKRMQLSGDDTTSADIHKDTFCFYNVTGVVKRQEDGNLDWHYLGPENDREWAWALNRHYFLRALYHAYRTSGNSQHARKFNEIIQEWILHNPCPSKKRDSPPWRALEAALRVSTWVELFYLFQESPEFSPATRVLMLDSFVEHGKYIKQNHVPSGNILVMELVALLKVAAFFPEIKKSSEWVEYAIPRLDRELLQKQVYPEGVQKELTQHYHYVSTLHFDDAFVASQYLHRSFSTEFQAGLMRMWAYLSYTMRPDGTSLLNNDSDLDDFRQFLLQKSDQHGFPSWKWMATNGLEGKYPRDAMGAQITSIGFPRAGQLIMRDSWGKDANWAFFDFGPFGTGHQHRDKLHISISAFGRQVLVDSGRYTYKPGLWRNFYFKATRAHNTALIDGFGQVPYEQESSCSLANQFSTDDSRDYAVGSYTAGYGINWEMIMAVPDFDGIWERVVNDEIMGKWVGSSFNAKNDINHSRAVFFNKSKQLPSYWIIVDRFLTPTQHHVTIPWHFHPSCSVEVSSLDCATMDKDQPNILIHPLGNVNWAVRSKTGSEDPLPQGWYSREYGLKQPSTCIEYTTKIHASMICAWLLVPSKGLPWNLWTVESSLGSISSFDLTFENAGHMRVEFSVDAGAPSCNARYH
ncbi:hypothetical protein GF325_16555 [Candidatus Bathyarchaeota archaeon]|nr:hypothetical protein [Candidatus Bathyarchaeota archaeon]